jgi:hypothetical protein
MLFYIEYAIWKKPNSHHILQYQGEIRIMSTPV